MHRRRGSRSEEGLGVSVVSNVWLVDAAQASTAAAPSGGTATVQVPQQRTPASDGWRVVDGHGAQLRCVATRSAALCEMGPLAMRGAELPLTLVAPDGHVTGDRLG